jgi:hypothetical protein
MDVLSAEQSLLVASCQRRGVQEIDPARLAPLLDDARRASLLGLASRMRVLGLALSAWSRPPQLERLPAAVADDIGSRLERLRERALRQEQQLDGLLALLGGRGLDPVVLKGAALRWLAFERPEERWLGDLDVLLPPERIDEALEALRAAGYTTRYPLSTLGALRGQHFHVPLRPPEGFLVEIHWDLSPASSPFRLPARELLSRATRLERPGHEPMRVPCAEHLLLHLAHENREDAWSRLDRLVDQDRIVASAPAIDWPYAERLAREGGLTYALALSFELGRSLLRTPVPAAPLRELRPPPITRLHLELLRPMSSLFQQRLLARPAARSALCLWSIVGWRRRAAYLLRLLRDRTDPLHWVWEGEPGPPPALAGLARGARAVLHLLALQLQLYAGAAWRLLTPPRRPRLGWWAD